MSSGISPNAKLIMGVKRGVSIMSKVENVLFIINDIE